MSPSERMYWQRAHRRVASLSPEMAAAVLKAFAYVRDSLTEAELARLIASGEIELLVLRAISDALLLRAFAPVRTRIRTVAERGFQFAVPSLPKRGQLLVQFDVLSPNVVTAIRELEGPALTTFKQDIRETVRAYVENGLRDGANPRAIARGIRGMIGLGPTQVQEVENFRNAVLRINDKSPFDYEARDKRYDAMLKRLFAAGKTPTAEQVDKMVTAYTKRRVALNSETVARTNTLTAFKVGQRLSWQQAIAKGIVDGGRLRKRWITVMDGRERPAHHDQNGDDVPFNANYRNHDTYAGEGDPWNCRCSDYVYLGSA